MLLVSCGIGFFKGSLESLQRLHSSHPEQNGGSFFQRWLASAWPKPRGFSNASYWSAEQPRDDQKADRTAGPDRREPVG